MKDDTSRWFPLCLKRLFPDASETPGEALCVHHSIEARGQRGNGSTGVACVQRLGDDDVYVGFLIHFCYFKSWFHAHRWLLQGAVSGGSMRF